MAAATAGQVRGSAEPPDEARLRFDVFFDAHYRDLARLAYLLSGDRDVADDLTAEAFTEAWQRGVAAVGRPPDHAIVTSSSLIELRVNRATY